jgi:hypothetical protein
MDMARSQLQFLEDYLQPDLSEQIEIVVEQFRSVAASLFSACSDGRACFIAKACS